MYEVRFINRNLGVYNKMNAVVCIVSRGFTSNYNSNNLGGTLELLGE